MTRTSNHLTFDEPTQHVLAHVGNRTRYVQAIIHSRERIWRSALRGLLDAGWLAGAIIAMCENAGPNIHTVEDWPKPLRDGEPFDRVIERTRMAAIVSEWWTGNARLRQELRERATEEQPS